MNLYCLPSPPPVGPEDEPEVELADSEDDSVYPTLLFTENETNYQRLYGGINENGHAKDAFHDHIISSHRPKMDSFFGRPRTSSHETDEEEQGPRTPFPDESCFVNPSQKGTKSGAHYVFHDVPGKGGCAVVRLKLTPVKASRDPTLNDEVLFDEIMEERRQEANEFYDNLAGNGITDDFKQIMRQALSGMLWSKQYYQFIQQQWIEGDPAQPPPPPERKWVRNRVSLSFNVQCILLRR